MLRRQAREQVLSSRLWQANKMAQGNLNGKALAVIGVGGIFAWSGLFNKKVTETIRDLIKGTKPVPGPGQSTPSENASIINEATGNIGATTNTAAQNQVIAKKLAIPFGWSGGQQWNCLVELWNKESGWSNTAENASGAYGIAQALPNTKYPKAGQPPSSGGSANATVQILWGFSYILGRYGSPCNAWSHETQYNWY